MVLCVDDDLFSYRIVLFLIFVVIECHTPPSSQPLANINTFAHQHHQSDYQRGYGSMPIEAYRVSGSEKGRIREIINDSRACHFSLGQDKVSYKSNNAIAAESVVGKSAIGDLAIQKANSAKMKAALQKTSIVIGDDENYF